ncbi:MAG: hypothetical protein CMP96_05575 [Gammaproteobacteria bacterium]|nr:hypothetical protein [Gammaproteobacteria bacterium]|tara:strand:- start:538 stop:819 length:282 start_codon:yes stop_codon:yes gene_type:complete
MTLKHITHNAVTGEITEVSYTAEEIAADEATANANALPLLRGQRDRLLTETDVYALADRTLSDEMRAYRQALRDLPANTSDPKNPTWPTKPSS